MPLSGLKEPHGQQQRPSQINAIKICWSGLILGLISNLIAHHGQRGGQGRTDSD